ncbi:hypothetical protein N9H39_06710 [Gammaproteobacteria bacterium]|nr:hypothetical protein [Gammaproteobacteria bacterium]
MNPDPSSENPRRIGQGRKITFSVILVLSVLLVVEVLAQLAYLAIYDDNYRPRKLHRLTSKSWMFGQDEIGVPNHFNNLVIHPYFGFVADSADQTHAGLGFGQWVSPMESRQHKDKLRVLVLGGSVAVQLMLPGTADGRSFLKKALEEAIARSGSDLELWMFSAAMQGFKQPQQLMVYSYLLSLGAEFDLIVNIDGFNEMTLAVLEGKPTGLHPTYPRGWNVMLGRQLTAGNLRKIAKLLKVRDDQSSLIEFAQSTPMAQSALIGLFLSYKVVANEERAQILVGDIEHKQQQGELSFEEGGIPFEYDNEEKTFLYLAMLWKRSSILLSQLAENNGAEYLHVFQPNQYLDGSKVLTEQERDKFYVPEDGFGPVYRAAYVYFHQQMSELVDAGEWFSNASMVFKHENQTVYSDVCCHFNVLGLRLLADFIAEEVVAKPERLTATKAKGE